MAETFLECFYQFKNEVYDYVESLGMKIYERSVDPADRICDYEC